MNKTEIFILVALVTVLPFLAGYILAERAAPEEELIKTLETWQST